MGKDMLQLTFAISVGSEDQDLALSSHTPNRKLTSVPRILSVSTIMSSSCGGDGLVSEIFEGNIHTIFNAGTTRLVVLSFSF